MTRAEHKRAATGGKDDWRTPRKVLDRVLCVGPIEFDPCAAPDPEHRFAARNCCDADGGDGTDVPWQWSSRKRNGIAFVNWPYSKSAAWVDKIIAEAQDGVPIVGLCASRPGAKWYRKAVAHADAVAEWRGRITFVGAPTSAPFPSALLAFNVSWRRFAAALADVADVYVPSLTRAA